MEVFSSTFIKGLNSKREAAWKELYDQFYEPLCHHANKILRQPQTAADIVQETLLKIWEANTRFIDAKALTAYLYRAVHNNALKYLRDADKTGERLQQWGDLQEELTEETFASIVEEEVVRKLKTIIATFPPAQQEVIRLTLDGLKVKEIAEKTNTSINTVKTQKQRAYKVIKNTLGPDFLLALLVLHF